MIQLFIIPNLETITFISSVLEAESLYELQYLIDVKGIKYMILNRSYFLPSEIEELLEL